MTFIVSPALRREVTRQLEFIDISGEPSADYSLGRVAVELPLGEAVIFGTNKSVSRAKDQDTLVLRPKVLVKPVNRIIHVECHPLLYTNGEPVFRRMWHDGQTAPGALIWHVTKDTDLTKLPYLFEVYIYDLHVR